MIPSIVISPPSSPRHDAAFPKHRPSTDLETIQEADHNNTNCLRPPPQQRTSSLSPDDTDSPHDINGNSEQPLDTSGEELDKLKSMATRLRLKTRRPSYVEWCENLPKLRDLNNCNSSDGYHGKEDWKTFKERRESLDEKIQWVRKELIEMKSQDHRLAIQLMRLRSEIQQLKLITSCHQHQDLIDTAAMSAQEDREAQQPALCDPPFRSNGVLFALEKPLKDFGVTRLNLFARRFSLC